MKNMVLRKGFPLLLACALVFTSVGTALYFTPTASAATGAPSYYGQAGYDGNGTLYLSTYLYNTSRDYFVAMQNTGWSIQTGGLETNGVSLGVGGTATSANQNEQYREFYDAGSKMMYIFIPITASGASNWTEIASAGTIYYSSIDFVKFSVNVTSAYPSVHALVDTTYNNGINVSSTYLAGTSVSKVAWSTAWYLLGALPAPYSWSIGTASYEGSLFQNVGMKSDSSDGHTGPGNFSQMNFGMYNGANTLGTDSVGSWGYDVYSASTLVQLTINSSDFLNSGQVNIGAQNYLLDENGPNVANSSGAYAGLNLQVTPAYTIQGIVTNNGLPVGNEQLELVSSSANYIIYTNASGYYRFFGDPGTDYTLEVPGTSFQSMNIPTQSTWVNGTTKNINLTDYTVSFSESGLPSGVTWSVTFNGYTKSSSSSSISFLVEDGSYHFSVSSPYYNEYGYTPNPSSGTITVSGSNVNQKVTYTGYFIGMRPFFL